MRYIKVTFSDGDSIQTGINGTNEVIEAYYLGNQFQMPSGMATAVKVEYL